MQALSPEDEAASWIAEAFETGNPLAYLHEPLAPRDVEAGERIAAAVLERLDLIACGIRIGPGCDPDLFVAGPILEGRLLASRTPVLLAALRHARATAALVGTLAEPLTPAGTSSPRFAALHPAIDIAASRFSQPAASIPLLAADLAGLGQVVAGRATAAATMSPDAWHALPVTLAPKGRRARPHAVDVAARIDQATVAARRLGGLPAGAILVVAGLSNPLVPQPGGILAAGLGPLGRVRASFA